MLNYFCSTIKKFYPKQNLFFVKGFLAFLWSLGLLVQSHVAHLTPVLFLYGNESVDL